MEVQNIQRGRGMCVYTSHPTNYKDQESLVGDSNVGETIMFML